MGWNEGYVPLIEDVDDAETAVQSPVVTRRRFSCNIRLLFVVVMVISNICTWYVTKNIGNIHEMASLEAETVFGMSSSSLDHFVITYSCVRAVETQHDYTDQRAQPIYTPQ